MKVICDVRLEKMEWTTDAQATIDKVNQHGKLRLLEGILDDLYPNPISESELDDLLHYSDEDIYEWCGISSEIKLTQQLYDAEEELESLEEEIKGAEREGDLEYVVDLMEEKEDLQKKIADLEKEIAEW